MMTPSERLKSHLAGIGPERLIEIDRRAETPDVPTPESVPKVDPDPFGRGWEWLYEAEASRAGARETLADNSDREERRLDGRNHLNLVVPDHNHSIKISKRPPVWIGGIAASIAAVALIGWFASSRGPLRERDVTAWVAQKLAPGARGIRIAAPAGDDEKAEEPLIRGMDRPSDALAPSAPNVYAPLRIQDQLVIPEVPPSVQRAQPTRRPVRSVAESVRPGELFYLEFATASTPSPGTAVVVSSHGDSSRLLWDEIAVSPADRTGYFGPIRMEDGEASYFVILADRTATPLLATASRALTKVDGVKLSPESLRESIHTSLEASGHSWYAIQRIEVRPEQTKTPIPKPVP